MMSLLWIALVCRSLAGALASVGADGAADPGERTERVEHAECVERIDRVARVERQAWVMGTRLRVVAERPNRAEAERVSEIALREVERFDRLLSTWDTASELSRANATPAGTPTRLGAELGALLREAEWWARRTGRAFDPTVGALVDAWGLRRARTLPGTGPRAWPRDRRGRPLSDRTLLDQPLPEQAFADRTLREDALRQDARLDQALLGEALAATGPGAVTLGGGWPDAPVILIRHSPRAWIDAGGFGKGAALRAAAERIAGRRDRRAPAVPASGSVLLDLGGQLFVSAPRDAPFVVAVAHPDRRHDSVATLSVHRGSVATSGDSQRPGHVLDPRTGRPVAPWGSVTVFAADPLEADVLSTALYVMGAEEGLAWARRAGIAALFLEHAGGALLPRWTPALEPRLLEAPDASSTPSTLPTKGQS